MTLAAIRHVPWALNTLKMRLQLGLSRRHIFGAFRVHVSGDAYYSVIQPSLTVTVTVEYETRCFY